MEHNIHTDEVTKQDDNNNPQNSGRSAPYPALTISEAYDFAAKINEQFSTVAEVTRDEIATAFKNNPSSIIRHMSSCVQYGFLDKNTAEGKYKLTQLFIDIFTPDSEKDKKMALITAFGSPKLNAELIKRFENNVIPVELPNTLTKYYGIRKEVAENAARIFIDSGKYVGVINENRVLKYQVTLSTISKTQFAVIEDVPASESNKTESRHHLIPATNREGSKNINIPIYLIGDKVSMFSYPEDVTEDDIEIIKHQIEGVLLRIKLTKKKAASLNGQDGGDS